MLFRFRFQFFRFSFHHFFVLVLVFVNEFVIFWFFTIFVFVNENHTGVPSLLSSASSVITKRNGGAPPSCSNPTKITDVLAKWQYNGRLLLLYNGILQKQAGSLCKFRRRTGSKPRRTERRQLDIRNCTKAK